MSHRFYLVSMPREVYLKVMPAKNLTQLDAILKNLGYHKGHPHDENDVLDYNKFSKIEYEFGSNFWDEAEKIIADSNATWCLSPLFHKDKACAPHVVQEHTLKTIIDVIKENIINYYKNLLKGNDATCYAMMRTHIEETIREWEPEYRPDIMSPINFNQNDEKLTNSWRYEYSIWELVKLYKEFDFENNTMLFVGW